MQKEYEDWLEKQSILHQNIQDTCSKYKLDSEVRLKFKSFMYDPVSKLLFCRNAKVIHIVHALRS